MSETTTTTGAPDDGGPSRSGSDVLAVEVVRGGLVESRHQARAVVTDPDGSVHWALGDPQALIYPRSSAKPFQAVAMLRLGVRLDGELLALAGASHSGEPFHLDGARRILAGVGRDVSSLGNIAALPLDDQALAAWLAAGHGPEPVAMNCSGKHAAMIATCVANGWDETDYLNPDSPLQRGIADTIAELCGEPMGAPTVDGCGAPLFASSLTGLARGFGRIAGARQGPEHRLAEAFRGYPEWASGTRRDEAALHRSVPGLVGKAGAEGVYAVGLPDGRGVALKIADGSPRARPVLMAAILLHLGIDAPAVHDQLTAPVLGHGQPVGEIRLRAGVLKTLHYSERDYSELG